MEEYSAYQMQFNETIEKWILWLEDYTLEQLRQEPRAGSWSLGQVYVHIIGDTNYFVEQMRICVSNGENSDGEMTEFATAMFASNEFPDLRLKGPSTDSSVRQPHSKEELSEALVSIRNEVNKLNEVFDFSTSIGKTEHPGFRFFNALEWLRFAEMHMRHHVGQKKRIDESLDHHAATPT